MADASIAKTDVEEKDQDIGTTYESGALLVPGQWGYFDTGDNNKVKLADCTAQPTAVVAGMVLNEVVKIGQPVALALTGTTVNVGAVLAGIGFVYILSEAGVMCPVADLASTDYLTLLGWSITSSQFYIDIRVSGLLNT